MSFCATLEIGAINLKDLKARFRLGGPKISTICKQRPYS